MIAATLDTNTLVSGFVRRNPASPVVQVVDAWRQNRYTLVVSEFILAEFERTLAQPYFRRWLSPSQRVEAVNLVRTQARIVEVTASVQKVATHTEDDLILATAVSAGVDYLVTGDKQLQKLREYAHFTILSSAEFCQVLDESSQP